MTPAAAPSGKRPICIHSGSSIQWSRIDWVVLDYDRWLDNHNGPPNHHSLSDNRCWNHAPLDHNGRRRPLIFVLVDFTLIDRAVTVRERGRSKSKKCCRCPTDHSTHVSCTLCRAPRGNQTLELGKWLH